MSRTTQEFGSAHTEKKLAAVQSYLSAFTTALKKQSFQLIYVDACAGSGSSKPRQRSDQAALLDVDDVTVGSAVRAMQIDTPFDRYFFSDTKLKNVKSLSTIVEEQFPSLAERVQIMRSDANQALLGIAETTDWKRSRAVVFLDPFGLQMKYSMVERLGRTKAVDLWYLVPVLGMSRQVAKDGSIIEPGGSLVDELLGTRDWRRNVLSEPEQKVDLFGPVSRLVSNSPPSPTIPALRHFERRPVAVFLPTDTASAARSISPFSSGSKPPWVCRRWSPHSASCPSSPSPRCR